MALPVISAMGVEACVLPTAVLATHTAFKGFTFRDLTADISNITVHWKQEKIGFDALYTGYLGSFEQIELMHSLISDFGGGSTRVIVDPCMGDNGALYSGFTPDFAKAMAGLCSKADVIVPNLTEASYMLGLPYVSSGYDKDYIEDLTEFYNNLEQEIKKLNTSEGQEKICPECGSPLVIRKGRYGEFTACSNYPECKYIKKEQKEVIEVCDCPSCDGKIVERKSKKGKIFYGCNHFPKCKTAYWDKPIGEKCPNCNEMLVEKNNKIKCSKCEYEK